MKWMQIKSIKAAAKRGEGAALRNCVRHHMQGHDVTLVELRDVEREVWAVGSSFCAMCVRTGSGCCGCALSTKRGCCDGLWRTMNNALRDFRAEPDGIHHLYKVAVVKLCEYIKLRIN